LKNPFYKKSFLSLEHFSQEDINYLIEKSFLVKKEKKENIYKYRLKNKNIAMIFEKNSTRTRCSTVIACFDEGGHAEFLGKDDIQMGVKESIKDTARVLGRMFDAIVFRGYKQETVEKLAQFFGIPVINALTDEEHPTQIIADFMTIKEVFGSLKGIKIAYLGDGRNNMVNSLIIGCAKMGINLSVGSPQSLWPDKNVIKIYQDIARTNDSYIKFIEDPYEAVKDSDVVYTDVWVSMGEENKKGIKNRIKILKPYTVTKKIMEATGKTNTIFLHCLPASHENEFHNQEVTEEVFESNQSYVFQQAENKMHSLKAILISILGGE